MKDYNLDRILIPAFKLFVTYNYEKVSTSLLEQETGLTRGAIFYKLRTKEDIFKAVVDKFILALQSENIPVGDSLIDFIDRYVDRISVRMNKLIELNIDDSKGYFSLIYQALQYYPGFGEKITNIFFENQKRWEEIVRVAQDSGEVKQSCDPKLTAQEFRYIYSGLSFERSLLSGLDVNELRELYYSIYNKIRNEE